MINSTLFVNSITMSITTQNKISEHTMKSILFNVFIDSRSAIISYHQCVDTNLHLFNHFYNRRKRKNRESFHIPVHYNDIIAAK